MDIYDPWVDASEVEVEYGFAPVAGLAQGAYDAIILAVAHDQFTQMSVQEFQVLGKMQHVLFDLKYVLDKKESSIRL